MTSPFAAPFVDPAPVLPDPPPAPRAVVAASPLVRAVGWVLAEAGGRWSGSTAELLAALAPRTADAEERAALGATDAVFGRRFAAALGELRAAGIAVDHHRSVKGGRDLRRWTLTCAQILATAAGPVDPLVGDFWREAVANDEMDTRIATARLYEAFVWWCGFRGVRPRPYIAFAREARALAARAGAAAVEIRTPAKGRANGYAGLRLGRWVEEEMRREARPSERGETGERMRERVARAFDTNAEPQTRFCVAFTGSARPQIDDRGHVAAGDRRFIPLSGPTTLAAEAPVSAETRQRIQQALAAAEPGQRVMVAADDPDRLQAPPPWPSSWIGFAIGLGLATLGATIATILTRAPAPVIP